jgi:hypothetical protein
MSVSSREPDVASLNDQDISDGSAVRAMGQQERHSLNLIGFALPVAAVWMGSAFCAALGLAALALAALGSGVPGTIVALKVTARFSFLLFWVAYAAGAMTTLFGPAFEPLKRRGREFGLAFASAHLVHLGLVAWITYIGAAPPRGVFFFLESPSCGPTFLRCSRSLVCKNRWGQRAGGSYAWSGSIT